MLLGGVVARGGGAPGLAPGVGLGPARGGPELAMAVDRCIVPLSLFLNKLENRIAFSAGVALSTLRVVTKNVSRGASRLQCVGRAKRFQCLVGARSPTTLVEGGVRRVRVLVTTKAIRSTGLTHVQF